MYAELVALRVVKLLCKSKFAPSTKNVSDFRLRSVYNNSTQNLNLFNYYAGSQEVSGSWSFQVWDLLCSDQLPRHSHPLRNPSQMERTLKSCSSFQGYQTQEQTEGLSHKGSHQPLTSEPSSWSPRHHRTDRPIPCCLSAYLSHKTHKHNSCFCH